MIRVTTPAPSWADFTNAGAMGAVLDFYGQLGPPAGALDLQRAVYGTAGEGGRPLELWFHGRADAAERRPGIVFVHGGSWAGGSPAYHLRHAFEAAARGYVTATISYRLSGEARWPACIEDVKCAVRWLRSSADAVGLDPDRIAVAGGSAGGHLAAMAALTKPGDLEGTGGNAAVSSALQAAVIWYPAVDFNAFVEQFGPILDTLLTDCSPESLAAASPLTHVSADAPPVLTMTGDRDELFPVAQLEGFHAALTSHRVPNELVVYEGRTHGFDFHPTDWVDCFARMTEFLDAHLALLSR